MRKRREKMMMMKTKIETIKPKERFQGQWNHRTCPLMRLSHLTQSSKKGPNEVDWAFKNWLENFLVQLTLSIAWITGMVCKVLGVKGFAAEEDLDCKEGESKGTWR